MSIVSTIRQRPHGAPAMPGRGIPPATRPSSRRPPSGFTLLEMLVAMAILVVIMLILTVVFDGSSRAWESGMRGTELAMEGRTVLNLIATELSSATVDGVLVTNVSDTSVLKTSIGGAGTLSFFTFGVPDATNRALMHVEYSFSGTTVERQETRLRTDGGDLYGSPDLGSPRAQKVLLLEGLESGSFKVLTPGGGTFTDELPEWVDIEFTLRADSDAATVVRVSSVGPDGQAGNRDDIKSWERL